MKASLRLVGPIVLSLLLHLVGPACASAAGRAAGTRQTAGAVVRLEVDARDVPRGVFRARLVIPVSPGPVGLAYPKWIPGEHGPTGPIAQLVNLRFEVAGKPVRWRRDSADMFLFRCDVPAGARELVVWLDYVSPFMTFNRGYGNSPNATPQLMTLLWNHLLLYPEGRDASDLIYQASLRLPDGWQFGTALPVEREAGGSVEFRPVPLATLVDSPLIAGRHFRAVPLTGGEDSPVRLEMVADSAEALDIPPRLLAGYTRLIAEADALFGARHYRRYHFLLALSDALTTNGIEHHESSDNRVPERTLLDEVLLKRRVTLLPHEYTHSWNGKYRRPAGLATRDYQQPMRGDLLWVYEGLTRYLGDLILTGRSGLRTPESSREYLAWVAANQDQNRVGRSWRPLADTAVAAQTIYTAPAEGVASRRGLDFYDEGLLIWLEADTVIRRQSGGAKTLDDFCRSFFGAPGGPPRVNTYELEDLLTALNGVARYDWRGFFDVRVNETNLHAPQGGLRESGWELVYTSVPNEYAQLLEQTSKVMDLSLSLGLWLRADGTVGDVVPGRPAYEAGLTQGKRVLAVNGVKWSPQAMRQALQASQAAKTPLELLVESGARQTAYRLDYHGGERYPHLRRIPARPDLLTKILEPLT